MKQLFKVVKGSSQVAIDGKTFDKKQDAKAFRNKLMETELKEFEKNTPKDSEFNKKRCKIWEHPEAFRVTLAKDHHNAHA